MENITNMNRNQLTSFIANFEHSAFHLWTAGVTETAHLIECALKTEGTTNAVPVATPSRLSGRPLTEEEVKELLYSAVHDLHEDIVARDTINEGGTSTIIPIVPDYYDETGFTDMWIDDYQDNNDYEHMSDDEQNAFDEKLSFFLEDHALYVVDLDSELGKLLKAFGWEESQTAFHSLTVCNAWANFLIVPENGVDVENILFADPEDAARFYEFALRKGITVSIDNRVDPYDVDIDVTRAFAEVYANLNSIELSDSTLEILAQAAADNAEVFALPLDSIEGRTLATLWGIPAQPTFADNLALYKAHEVIALHGNVYRMQAMRVELQHRDGERVEQ